MNDVLDGLLASIHSSAHKAQGGLERLAKTMGLNAQSLRNKVNPVNDVAKLSVAEWRSLLMITNDITSLTVLCNDLGFRLVEVDGAGKDNLLTCMLNLNKESGDVAAAIQEALADGKISLSEKVKILKEIDEQKKAVNKLERSLDTQ